MSHRLSHIFIVSCLLSACGYSLAKDKTCSDAGCIEAAFEQCAPAVLEIAQGELGRVEYQVKGPVAEGCAVNFQFLDNPNPAWENKPLRLVLDPNKAMQPQVKAAVGGCLTHDPVATTQYQCSGPLAGVTGRGASAAADVPAGGPQFSGKPLAESSCGKPVGETFPELLKWYDRAQGKWGFANRRGEWMIAAQWIQVTPFSEGRAFVVEQVDDSRHGKRWSMINTQGEYVARHLHAPKNQTRTRINGREMLTHPSTGFSQGCAAFSRRYGNFYLDRDGKAWLSEPTASMQSAAQAAGGEFYDLGPFHVGLARFSVDLNRSGSAELRYGYINNSGEVVIAPTYVRAGNFSADKGLAPVTLFDDSRIFDRGEALFVNRQGEQRRIADGVQLEGNGAFSEGWAPAQEGRRWTFTDGKKLLHEKPLWERVEAFHQGRAPVYPGNEEIHFIDTHGKVQARLSIKRGEFCGPIRFHYGLALTMRANDASGCGKGNQTPPDALGAEFDYSNAHYVYVDMRGQTLLQETAP